LPPTRFGKAERAVFHSASFMAAAVTLPMARFHLK
jgi:hypothetical protein